MIIIPEIQTVVLTPPRTGSTSLLRAAQATYPHTMSLYRHMEADGVPHGYDRWRKVGLVRHPHTRLWSLYNYMRNPPPTTPKPWAQLMREDTETSFELWMCGRLTPFTHPYWLHSGIGVDPRYQVLHPLPEQRKSLAITLRPDLGTEIFIWERDGLQEMAFTLGLTLTPCNASTTEPAPELSRTAKNHLGVWFGWEFNRFYGGQP
jgi:hypothetical protein